jgi:hypothetical protein
MRRLKQQDILDYLRYNPGSTEGQIQVGAWGYMRNTSWEANKKYADILRRALYSGKIKRLKVRDREEYKGSIYRYCLESQSFDVIFSQIRK